MSFKQFRRRQYLKFRKWAGRSNEDFAPHGVPVHIPEGSDLAITYLLAKGRPYEGEEAGMVRDFLRPGMNVIELGGCFGVVSALIRKTVGPEARHIIVEANPALIAPLTRNASQGAAPGRTEVKNAAVDYSGAASVTFSIGPNAHMGHLGAGGGQTVTVPALRLSDLAATLPEGPYALVCDIEGAELDLFAAEAAALDRIDLVVLETHPRAYPGGRADLDAMLARLRAAGLEEVRAEADVVCYRRTGR
ncbi:MAG: FkbM family methyltransferase [Rhodobacteraceae bacterium]|nr:FkbM family methyltransferase [Paracoccaceae bacterium]